MSADRCVYCQRPATAAAPVTNRLHWTCQRAAVALLTRVAS